MRLAVGSIATGAFLWLFLRIAHLGDAWDEITGLPWWAVTAALGFVLANSAEANASAVARDIGAIYFGHPYTIPAPARGRQ